MFALNVNRSRREHKTAEALSDERFVVRPKGAGCAGQTTGPHV